MTVSTVDRPGFVRFGEKLRDLRTRHGLTLIQLAERLGYKAHGHLSEIESGKKSPTRAVQSRLFGDVLLKDEMEIE